MPAASSGTAWVWGGGPQDTRWDASFSPAAFLRSGHSLQLQKGPVPHPAGKPGPAPHLHHGPEQHRLRPRELHGRRGPRPALQLRGRAGRPGHGRAHPGVGSGATPGQPQAPYTHHQDHSWQGGAAEPGAAAEVAAVHWGAGTAGRGAEASSGPGRWGWVDLFLGLLCAWSSTGPLQPVPAHSLVTCRGAIASTGCQYHASDLLGLFSCWVRLSLQNLPTGLGLSLCSPLCLGRACVPCLAPATDSHYPAARWRLSRIRTRRTGVEESSTPLVFRWKRTRGRSGWGYLRLPWGRRGEEAAQCLSWCGLPAHPLFLDCD